MFKKALIASAVLAASTGMAFANGGTVPPAPHHTHSVYAGVAVSRDFLNYNATNGGFKTDIGDSGWNGEVNAGIGWTFQNHYYLAGEIFGAISSVDAKSSAGAFGSSSLKARWSTGIAVIPGIKVTDSTMLYGRVGYILTQFKGSGNALGQSASKSKWKSGIQLGLGMEAMVTNNVSARLEYDWNRYGKLGGSNPTIDQVKLGVEYHFMSA